MSGKRSAVGAWINQAWDNLLSADNHIIGFVICIFAGLEWLTVYDGIGAYRPYLSQGIYALPSLSTLNTFFSAVYLTFAAIILLSLRQPLSRYRSVWPNLLALTAAFGVYAFVFVPSGNLFRTSAIVALALIVCGSILVIMALIFLRQAFTVTPQARFLVTCGPYSIIRHPMYVGNILSILGLALLIDSEEAVLLFVVCAGLQIGRALSEERLLASAFPQYAAYKAKVGGFVPRLRLWPIASPALCLCLVLVPQPSPGATVAAGIVGTGEDLLSRVAANIDARKCTDWSRKARGGNLFTANEQAEMEVADGSEKSSAIPACKTFFELRATCQLLSQQHADNEINDAVFLEKIDASPGCMSLVAAEVCKSLKTTARSGQRLPENRLAFMGQCIQVEITDKRFNQIRPAM